MSWLAAATVLCVCVPPGQAHIDSSVQVTAGDIAAAVLVACAALAALSRGLRLPPNVLWVFGPMVLALAVSTLCARDVVMSLTGFVRVLEIFLLVPAAVMLTLRRRRDSMIILGAVALAGLLQAGIGIWQVVTHTGASFAGRNTRAVGTFGAVDVMAMATVVGYSLIIVLAVILTCSDRRVRLAMVPAAAVLGVALGLALSRGSWLAVTAGVAVMLALWSRKLALRAAVGAVAVAIVVVGGFGWQSSVLGERAQSITASFTQPDQSVGDRFSLWTTAFGIWQDNPVTGVGAKGFPAHRDGYAPMGLSSGSETEDPQNGYLRQPLLSPHNQYLLILAEQGLAGVIGFVILLGGLVVGLARRRRADLAWLVAAGFMTTSLTAFAYGDLGGPTCVLTAVMIGMVAAAALSGPAERHPLQPSGRRSRGRRSYGRPDGGGSERPLVPGPRRSAVRALPPGGPA
ncbi:O-antigen ligase family protein [Spirillospora sp. NPDC047279]|uniref:O-antigen ligase family protein n=1 Tax=Spirillospora sp. NPDC047279 TaxID=3155478 RepID=UPI003400577B